MEGSVPGRGNSPDRVWSVKEAWFILETLRSQASPLILWLFPTPLIKEREIILSHWMSFPNSYPCLNRPRTPKRLAICHMPPGLPVTSPV